MRFQDYFEDQLLEMVRVASPVEAEDWLRNYLQRSLKSPQAHKQINAPYWLQSDNFEKLLSKFLLILRFETDPKVIKNRLSQLLSNDLQKDVGFGSRRNIEYAKSLGKKPEVVLHPAYGTDVAYRRPVLGGEEERFGRGARHTDDVRTKMSQNMVDAWARRKQRAKELQAVNPNPEIPQPAKQVRAANPSARIPQSVASDYKLSNVRRIRTAADPLNAISLNNLMAKGDFVDIALHPEVRRLPDKWISALYHMLKKRVMVTNGTDNRAANAGSIIADLMKQRGLSTV